ncbi:hypothetical protein A9G35_03715 [Gilliamella sp. Choc5-1]|nr:hypothetical protein [Gilliamella apicola]OCG47498.1 hypothetical protein A9G35_03715 [Gilliamella apicola]
MGLFGCPVSVNKAIHELNNGAEKVFVKSRSDAEELFMKRYLGDEYLNMTGESGPSAKNLLKFLKNTDGKTKSGTYHWDDIKDINGRVAGHSPSNPDGILPHLQIHEKSGKIIHIFFQWDS